PHGRLLGPGGYFADVLDPSTVSAPTTPHGAAFLMQAAALAPAALPDAIPVDESVIAKPGEERYSWVLSEESLLKIQAYQQEVAGDINIAGGYLKQELHGKDGAAIAAMSVAEFFQALMNAKKPKVFAESEWAMPIPNGQPGAGEKKWTRKEFSLMADVNCHVPVTVYDTGNWNKAEAADRQESFEAHLLFTPGPLLKSFSWNNFDPITHQRVEQFRVYIGDAVQDRYGSQDRLEVVDEPGGIENAVINQEKYNAMIERRFLPLLVQANAQAEQESGRALVTLPGIGCGNFGGEFADGRALTSLTLAMNALLEKYHTHLPHIKGVVMDTFGNSPDATSIAGCGFTDFQGPANLEKQKRIGNLHFVLSDTKRNHSWISVRPQ
ncbi:MAG: hypothetical protein EB015_22265, partial [Methylocystaceae bacterium]|nr:hypothetical protein [Methylocystaceae bacterium]